MAAAAQPVINEIHYDPPNPVEPAEFVELHNPGTAAIALGGWRLAGGVSYGFPAGTALAPGAYLVVAQDPAQVQRQWGVAALGPWEGRLGNDREVVELTDTTGVVADRVEYRRGFPWPTIGDPPGYSIELLDPGLDNDLGGNWRASVAGGGTTARSTLIEAGSDWRFFRGRSEASTPTTAWRDPGFDASAWETGALPIGFDPAVSMRTALGDMRGAYISVFLRREFAVSEASAVTALELEALYDDGFKVWINGEAVLNANIGGGEVAFDAAAGAARESNAYESFSVPVRAGLLREGANWIAVQAHNASVSASSDFYFDVRVVGVRGPTGQGPTPGRVNVVRVANAPPALRQVEHAPRQPRSGDPVRITVRASDPDGVGSVECRYQVVRPGAYVERTDAAYEAEWTPLPMRDDGTGGDVRTGDGLYTALVPAAAQGHRNLVRYRIRAADGKGQSVTVPYADDPQPNFAYFVYNGVPEWRGAVRPGAAGAEGQVFTVSSDEMNRLPVIHLIARQSTVEDATWFSRYGGDAYQWTGTLVFDGQVYDHIKYRARGGVWRYAMTKNMWKFDFQRGHDFEAVDDWGRKLAVPWTKLNLGASIQQGDFNHRGEQGMFESTGFRIFRLAGVPAMHSAFVQFRVIDGAEEASAASQYEGDFWGLYLMLEQPDGRFLEQHGLADGNLYKMEGGGGEPNNLGPAGPADGSDLNAFLGGYDTTSEAWWRANFEVATYLSYQTVVQAIHHYDICYDKNFLYYRDPGTGRWQVIPWDLDLTWAENMFDAGCGGVDRVKQRLLSGATRFPAIWRAWQNRIREFRDLFWNADEAGRLIDEQAGRLRGPASGPTLLDADRAQWDYNPKMADNRYSSAGSSKAGQGRFYRWPNYAASDVGRDFGGTLQVMKRYVGFRATNTAAQARSLDSIAGDAAIPRRPALASTGPTNFPVNALRFRCSSYSGSSPFAAMRWRVGEITRPTAGAWAAAEPWKYELEPVWESGRQTAFAADGEIPAEALRVGGTYRVRVQFEDAEGRTSQWSEPVEFVAGASDQAAALAADLQVTEVMYHAAAGSTNDFLELHNAGKAALGLGGARFTQGIDYTFPGGTTLPAGGYLLVVKASATGNFAAFRAAYGLSTSVPVYGPYSGNLADAGETVTLSSAAGGAELMSFTYGDGWGWPVAADGAGHSLVPRRDFGADAGGALDFGGNWRASAFVGGSPGGPDPTPDTNIVLNEVVAHTDFLSEYDSNDWVELYNRGTAPVTLGAGWYLSDSDTNLRQWAIPAATVIPAGGRVVFDEVTGFNRPAGTGFSLNKAGEQVFLSQFASGKPGRVVDAVRFAGQENDWAYARVPDGGDWWDQVAPRTRAQANASIQARVAISEILYHEGGLPTNRLAADWLEYVELQNAAPWSVELYNTNAVWRLNGGIEFDFPLGLVLAGNERVVVVPFDPVANPAALAGFRATFGVASSVRVFGPYQGRLDNDTDRVALERAQSPDQPGDPISWVIVDAVDYFDSDPWPSGADGEGRSLHRLTALRPGGDPASWQVGTPTPGSGPPVVSADGDADGMPDAWEREHGLDPGNQADAAEDADGDGSSNLGEYQAGTDPRDPASALRLTATRVAGTTTVQLVFRAVANRAYVVEESAAAGTGAWTTVQSVPAAADRVVTVAVPVTAGAGGRFHRVRLL